MPESPSPAAVDDATKGDRTRRRLLDAAATEIAQHGPTGASLAAIARRAGLKAGSVYFHFSSRDRLIEAVLEEGLRGSIDHLDRALEELAGSGDARDRLRAAMRGHLGALEDLSDYAVVVLAPQFTVDREAVPGYRALRREYMERWTRLIVDAQDQGALAAPLDPRSVRDLVLGALNSAGLAGRPVEESATTLEALLLPGR